MGYKSPGPSGEGGAKGRSATALSPNVPATASFWLNRIFGSFNMEAADPLEPLATESSDIRFLLSSHNVEELSQAELFENGIDMLVKFAAFVTSEEELTRVLKANFGLDPEASLKVRGQVASYLWNGRLPRPASRCRPKPRLLAS